MKWDVKQLRFRNIRKPEHKCYLNWTAGGSGLFVFQGGIFARFSNKPTLFAYGVSVDDSNKNDGRQVGKRADKRPTSDSYNPLENASTETGPA